MSFAEGMLKMRGLNDMKGESIQDDSLTFLGFELLEQ